MSLYYVSIIIDDNIEYSIKNFTNTVRTILTDKRGWTKLGYEFVFVSNQLFNLIKNKNKILIRLSKNETIAKECKFNINEKLSCCDTVKKTVLINYYRWQNGSNNNNEHHNSLDDYRIYVINHEVGHALGRGHTKCNPKKCEKVPVMMQQTLSIGTCKKNVWPLEYE